MHNSRNVRMILCSLQWHNTIKVPHAQSATTLREIVSYSKTYNAVAQDLFYVKSLGKRARVEYEESVYNASTYVIKYIDGTSGPADQRELNICKRGLYDFHVAHNKAKRNKKTLSMEEDLASDYTSLTPYDGTVVKSNIKRVSLLCNPTLRAALPPLANDAPPHLKPEVSKTHIQQSNVHSN
jgi:hypothetical protein